jgi:hypothetical protein
MTDLTIPELISAMENLISKGCIIHVKFDCPNCKSRQTSQEPNALHVLQPDVAHDEMIGQYYCEECGKLVFPKKFGFLVMKGIGGKNEKHE